MFTWDNPKHGASLLSPCAARNDLSQVDAGAARMQIISLFIVTR